MGEMKRDPMAKLSMMVDLVPALLCALGILLALALLWFFVLSDVIPI